MKKLIIFIVCYLITSCNLIKKTQPLVDDDKCKTINNDSNNCLYVDFSKNNLSSCNIEDTFYDIKAIRRGSVKNGCREGYFGTGIFYYDIKTDKNISRIRVEYFKKGLRDSIFRQFDSEGKIIYETTFSNGTGLWKEFHGNGKIYFEANTKEGYFTDTLRLYNEKGELFEKILYDKDKVVFRQKMIVDDFPTDNK